MVKRIQTRVVFGTRETPNYVSKSFWDTMESFCSLYQYEFRLRPNTVRYYIPSHMVVDRIWQDCQQYYIDIDDSLWIPTCNRKNVLERTVHISSEPKQDFDRFQVTTEEVSQGYYLLTPDAKFYHTYILKEWSTRFLYYNDIVWKIEMSQVYMDPHNSGHTIWLFSHPKYSVEMTAFADFRGPNQDETIQTIVQNLLPEIYRWG